MEGSGILLLGIKHNNEFADRVCVKTEGNFRWQTSHWHLHREERQPEGVQVVEGVVLGSNLIPSIFIIVLF